MNLPHDPWDGLRPASPPVELRARVLAAAREAAAHARPGLVEALIDDRMIRACAAAIVVLGLANLAMDRGGVPIRAGASGAPPAAVADDGALPEPGGLTAAEQLEDLAPLLDVEIGRSRG